MSDEAEALLASGVVERLGQPDGRFWLGSPHGETLADMSGEFPEHRAAVRQVFDSLEQHGFSAPDAVGHRLAHGGPDHTGPQRIDASLLAALRRLIPLSPLHLPSELEIIAAVAAHFPDLPQAACFDTAFHRTMPELAQRLPLPRDLWGEGLRRYGFHGLSYEYVVSVLGAAARRRTIIGHLGNGATLVVTGGIGERAAPVRWEICEGLEHLGVRLDPSQNSQHAATISAVHSACTVRVIPTKEDLMIARHTRAVLSSGPTR